MDFLKDLLNHFNTWLSQLFSKEIVEVILEQHKLNNGELQLVEFLEAGVVDWNDNKSQSSSPKIGIWKIDVRNSDAYLYIILLNIGKLKQELGEHYLNKPLTKKVVNNGWRIKFIDVAKLHLKRNTTIVGSHIFLAVWVSKEKTVANVIEGKSYKTPLVETQSIIICDLQGVSRAWTGDDTIAKQVVRLLVQRIVYKLWNPKSALPWATLVKSINMTQWLEVYSAAILGEHHTLQPKKSRTAQVKKHT